MRRKTGQFYLFKMVSRTSLHRRCRCAAALILSIVLFMYAADIVSAEETTTDHGRSTTISITTHHHRPKLIPIGAASVESSFHNVTLKEQNVHIKSSSPLSTGNELWDGLINDCLRKPTFSCLQKNVHNYLDKTLNLDDVNVTSGFVFLKNKVDVHKYTKEANDPNDSKENEIPDIEARSDSPLEEVTDALSDKGVQFLMTHDVELKLPDILFNGATFRMSPRSFEGNGALVKMELIPRSDNLETGRIFFKKIKKFVRNKLLLSFLAIVLVIKLIKIKLFWLLPLIVGVTTAKKLLLKLVLFLFPALANIFKLCSFYHRNFHDTKYHHHQHQINHLHTVVPTWYNEPPHEPEIIYTSPPKGHPSEYLYGAPPPQLHQHVPQEWESSGPGLGSEYISDIHRNAQVNTFRSKLDDLNEINSWGLGTTTTPQSGNSHQTLNVNPLLKEPATRIGNLAPSYKNPVYVNTKNTAAANIAAQYTPVIDQKATLDAQRIREAQQLEALRIQAEKKLVAHQQRILQNQHFIQSPEATVIIDPYYSPILSKMDQIFLQLGFTDEACRERLVCSMYKHPSRFSPHSNFISAELSRDSSELHKPTSTNAAVIRFYRYVQAARDGQDQKDCIRLYTNCMINTEK